MYVYRLADRFTALIVNFVIDVRVHTSIITIIYLLLLLSVVLTLLEAEKSRFCSYFTHTHTHNTINCAHMYT